MSGMTSAMAERCPRCGVGPLYDGWFSIRETCPHCAARYLRWEGSWVGPTVGGYTVGGVVGIAGGLALNASGHWFEHAETVVALLACGVVVAVYRPIKSMWIGVLHDAGYVFPDPPQLAGASTTTLYATDGRSSGLK